MNTAYLIAAIMGTMTWLAIKAASSPKRLTRHGEVSGQAVGLYIAAVALAIATFIFAGVGLEIQYYR